MGLKYLEGVATLALDAGKCVSCGVCGEVCPHGVFDLSAGKARVADKDACMECGACALNCPAGAVTVDSGVGCAVAFRRGWATGGEACCDAGGDCC
jgi:NAD-dependent dihydropyrimidine dehydrogenase PreA subunit